MLLWQTRRRVGHVFLHRFSTDAAFRAVWEESLHLGECFVPTPASPDIGEAVQVELAVGPRDAILQAITDFEHFHRPNRGGMPGDDNVVAIVDYLLTRAVRDRASDIHIEPMHNRVRVRYRIDGELVHRTDVPLYLAPKIASRIKVMCNADLAERRKHQGGRILYKMGDESIDMRVSIYVTVHGENIVIRILHKATGVLPIEKLGMLPALLQRYKDSVLEVPTGVVLYRPSGLAMSYAKPVPEKDSDEPRKV